MRSAHELVFAGHHQNGGFGSKSCTVRRAALLWISQSSLSLSENFVMLLLTDCRLGESIKHQYDILEGRLSEAGQNWIALADRPTIADVANLPFANTAIAGSAGWDLSEWPKLKAWSERMLARPAIQRAHARVIKFGIEDADESGMP